LEALFGLLVVAAVIVLCFKSGASSHKSSPPVHEPKLKRSGEKRASTRPKYISPAPKLKPALVHPPSSEERSHAPPPPIPSSRRLSGKAYVIDGDTIVISKIKIRLAGIDAPELDQPWGQKSKWEMVKICKGQTLNVELTGETSYDRLVGTCYLPDGRDIGAEIIKAGLALDGGHYSVGKYLHLEPEGVRRRLRPFGNKRRKAK